MEIEDIGKISQVSNSMISMVYYSLITRMGAVVISKRYSKIHGINGQDYGNGAYDGLPG